MDPASDDEPEARSLNLSNCVAIVLFEVLRQTGFMARFAEHQDPRSSSGLATGLPEGTGRLRASCRLARRTPAASVTNGQW